jgi:predicted phage terminase large subunit-like protein
MTRSKTQRRQSRKPAGTPWHEDDLICRTARWIEEHPGEGRLIRLPAYAEEDDQLGRAPGEPLWPERLGVEELELRRRMLDQYWWQALYQLRPGNYGRYHWPAEYFRDIWADPEDWPEAFEVLVIALDPSIGRTSKGDYTAAIKLGLTRGLLWVDAQVRRRDVPTMCAETVDFAAAGPPVDLVAVESNYLQELLINPLGEASMEAGHGPLPLVGIDNRSEKVLRISRLGPWLARGRFRFRDNRDTRLLVDQLRAFPLGDHDDGPDALEMALRTMRAYLQALDRDVGEDEVPEELLAV